jgi:hypothetical protein
VGTAAGHEHGHLEITGEEALRPTVYLIVLLERNLLYGRSDKWIPVMTPD